MSDPMKIRCPRCGQEAVWQGNPYRPFCCERCQLADLGAWASEEYRIVGRTTAPAEDEEIQ